MTIARLAARSLAHYRRTHLAAVLGVATAVAVLAGSLVVGASVRESLRAIAVGRIGATSVVVGAAQPFPDSLAERMALATGAPVAPLLNLAGAVTHESSGRKATRVTVYGVDERFFALHGVASPALTRSNAFLSADLARELGAADDDAVVVRISRPTDIPIDSLHGRRDEAGRAVRLTMAGAIAREGMGEFTLAPTQGPVRGVFVSLARLQRDLAIEGRVNTLLVAGAATGAGVTSQLAATAGADDLGLKVDVSGDIAIVESRSGLLSDALIARLQAIAAERAIAAAPVLTWLATSIRSGDREVPYSLVAAIAPGAAGVPMLERVARLRAPSVPSDTSAPSVPIVLNEWTARDLHVQPGAPIELEYYRWADEGRLVTERASFRLEGVVPMSGSAIERRWAPDYPGITTASDVSDWDPPFPIDLKRVRQQDEDYWDRYRTAPKAFIPLAAGQEIWRTRHGQATSVRLRMAPQTGRLARAAIDVDGLRTAIARGIDPLDAGFSVVDLRAQHVSASAGATDFGAYFSYFSFFLMVSALLLAALFFRLSIEQRLPQLGVLRAAGFSLADLRRLLLIESALIVSVGALAGVVLAVGWAALMMFALRTWWIGAVGTSLLALHVEPGALVAGAIATAIAALLSVSLTVRALSRLTPRAQITGTRDADVTRRRRRTWPAAVAIAAALSLTALSVAGFVPAAAGFFGGGALVLVSGLMFVGAWLAGADARRPRSPAHDAGLVRSVNALALRNASWRPGRSLTIAGLVAAALFLLVSVDSFRKTGGTGGRDSGTGGFALIAESVVPIVHDLNAADGRDAAGLIGDAAAPLGSGVQIHALRLRPGDDASCLNLYQPKQPRIAAVPESWATDDVRFAFARVVADADAEARANPWRLLARPGADGVVPAIVDQTSLQYVLHAAVGDVITVDAETTRPLRLRIVASLADSVLQGEVLIGDAAFRQVFPDIAGYRMFLVEVAADGAAEAGAAEVARALESGLDPYGFDAEDAKARLEAFHRVENTYLSTFQALGGLGLVLGCVGLVAVVLRNVLERRRELALLGAAGFTGADLRRLVTIEHVSIVGVGLVVGLAAAAVAVAPVVVDRGGAPWRAMIWVVPVAVAGLAAAWGATRTLARLPLVASLRNE